jgi:hypothetical protein
MALQFNPSNKADDIYNQLLYLKFEDWRIQSNGYGTALMFRDLIKRTPLLCTLEFSGSFVDGEALVDILGKIISDSGEPEKCRDLQEVTLAYTTGIMNDQCKGIIKLVKRVNIYM